MGNVNYRCLGRSRRVQRPVLGQRSWELWSWVLVTAWPSDPHVTDGLSYLLGNRLEADLLETLMVV